MKEQEKKDTLRIKDWAESDRPREKMLNKGADVLTDAELLAILLRTGNANDTAVSLSQKILSAYGNDWDRLAHASVKDLVKSFNGVGETKAITIMAALEVGRRRKSAAVKQQKLVKSSADLYDYFFHLSDLNHEEFWVVCLAKSGKILASQRISQGGLDKAMVDIRVMMKFVMENSAVAIAVCHNHPSGNKQPSREDIALTNRIMDACKVMDIKFLDHIIVTSNGYYSFVDEGTI